MPRHNEIVLRYRDQKNALENVIAEKQRIRDAPGAHNNPHLEYHLGQLSRARWQLCALEDSERAEIDGVWTAYYVLWPGARA